VSSGELVTERDRAQEAFTKALLDDDPETLYERAPCGYLSTTPDGTIVKVNETFLTWTGHARKDLVGHRTFASLLTAGGRIYHDTHYAPMLHMQEHVREIALDVVTADGQRLPVLVNAALGRDDDGEPVVVRVVLFDATERRGYERELLRAKQLAEASELKARALARALQQTLIPPHPPEIPGLDVAAVYRPAGSGEEVGGDFYDVFQVGTDDWVVAVGDVCGKGVEAAILTALVRHTLRAVAMQVSGPAEALHALNEVLLHHQTDRFCTIAVLRLRLVGERWRLTMSLGGHPQPIMLGPGGLATAVGSPGSLVGILPDPTFEETQVPLDHDATLVLYTDGVTEARRGDELYGDERLRATALRHDGSPATVSEEVLRDVLDFQGGSARDDIAVLALRTLTRVREADAPPS